MGSGGAGYQKLINAMAKSKKTTYTEAPGEQLSDAVATTCKSVLAWLRGTAVPILLSTQLATPATAYNGPYSTLVTVQPGVQLDTDVRWPDKGVMPANGWPVIIFAHGAAGDKNSNAGRASQYADNGYVTLTYTNRTRDQWLPTNFANDVVALKNWLLNNFELEAGIFAPTNADAYGMTGNSLGGYTTWSVVLLSDALAAAVPFNFGYHNFIDYIANNGSIELTTGANQAMVLPGEYPAAALDQALDAVFGPVIANMPSVTIPVQNHIAMLDARWPGTYALSDHLAISSSQQRMLYLGTGGHGTPNGDALFRDDLRKRWFDHYLKGEINGIDSEEPVRMALLGTNEHLSFSSWPPAAQSSDELFLAENGRLMLSPPTAAVKSDIFVNNPGNLSWETASDLSASTIRSEVVKDLLSYDSAPLANDTLVVGEPSVSLYVEGSGSRYQINAHLYDVSPQDEPILLAAGTTTTNLSPTQLTISLSATGRRVPAGHRLRLEITNRDDQDVDYSNGYAPESGVLRFVPFLEYSENKVFFDASRPSSITIPILDASELELNAFEIPLLPWIGSTATLIILGAIGMRKMC